MMSKKFAWLSLAFIMLLLAACGNTSSSQLEQVNMLFDNPMRQYILTDWPEPGTWDGNIYTNEYLGLRFIMPGDWFIATDDEIADAMEFGAYYLDIAGGELPDDYF